MTSGYRASGCSSNPCGSRTCAPRYIGRPQNFVSRSLWIRTCLMYFVSGGSGIGGMTLSSEIWIAPAASPGRRDLPRRGVEVAGRAVPLLALAPVHRQLDGLAVGAGERLVAVEQRLDGVGPRRAESARLRAGSPRRRRRPTPARRAACLDVDAGDQLCGRVVVDLEARLVAVVVRDHDEQPAVDRPRRRLGRQADIEPIEAAFSAGRACAATTMPTDARGRAP